MRIIVNKSCIYVFFYFSSVAEGPFCFNKLLTNCFVNCYNAPLFLLLVYSICKWRSTNRIVIIIVQKNCGCHLRKSAVVIVVCIVTCYRWFIVRFYRSYDSGLSRSNKQHSGGSAS